MNELKQSRIDNGLDGIFFIDSGRCQIINNYCDEKVFTDLGRGDIIGLSYVIKRLGIEYFGDTIAAPIENQPNQITQNENSTMMAMSSMKFPGMSPGLKPGRKLSDETNDQVDSDLSQTETERE